MIQVYQLFQNGETVLCVLPLVDEQIEANSYQLPSEFKSESFLALQTVRQRLPVCLVSNDSGLNCLADTLPLDIAPMHSEGAAQHLILWTPGLDSSFSVPLNALKSTF